MLCLGAATKDAFTHSAFWLSGLTTGEAVAGGGYFHSHGVGELAHWHPFPVADSEPTAKPQSGETPGYRAAIGDVHDHVCPPAVPGVVATLSIAQALSIAPPTELGRLSTRVDASSSKWRAMRPRGPPAA